MVRFATVLGIAAVLLANVALPVDAKNHDPASHRHAFASIDPHCVIPAFAKRHPDKCAGYPITPAK